MRASDRRCHGAGSAQDGTLPQEEIEATLNRVQHLADITGCDSLLPELREQQARLAAKLGDAAASNRLLHEAFNGYQEIGATGHVTRLAGELTP